MQNLVAVIGGYLFFSEEKIQREILCSIQNMFHSSFPLKNLALSHQKVAANMFFSTASAHVYI